MISNKHIQALKELLHERPAEAVASDVVLDLLARLESAEKFCDAFHLVERPMPIGDGVVTDWGWTPLTETWQAWRALVKP